MTTDIFPSYILEPKTTIENISWFLNPIEEPPQKFLHLQNKNSKTPIYSDLLEKEGFIVKNITLESFSQTFLNQKIQDSALEDSYFNIIFSLANEDFLENLDEFLTSIHNLLKPSSYFIIEIKIGNNFDQILESFETIFESVNLLTPWSELKTNPFSPFDNKKSNYCWIAALSKNSDYDPGEWMESF